MLRRVRAREAHEIPDRAPLRVTPGERVRVGERDGTWPAFVYVTAAGGEGWVPSRHLRADDAGGTGEAVVADAYDTTELPVAAGQEVDVLAEDLASGWLWCRDDDGREGWVPVAVFDDAP